MSELGGELYDLCLRPLVQSVVTPRCAIAQALDLHRDARDAWCELAFYRIYGSPLME